MASKKVGVVRPEGYDARIGSKAKGIVRNLVDVTDANADLLAAALADLMDGDNDTSTAQRNLLRVLQNEGGESRALNQMLRDEMNAAEDTSEAVASAARSRR